MIKEQGLAIGTYQEQLCILAFLLYVFHFNIIHEF